MGNIFENQQEAKTVEPMLPVDAIQPRSEAWILNDDRKAVCVKVDRIECSFIAKPNVYSNEKPYNERIVYHLGGCTRMMNEVYRSKEELLASL